MFVEYEVPRKEGKVDVGKKVRIFWGSRKGREVEATEREKSLCGQTTHTGGGKQILKKGQ